MYTMIVRIRSLEYKHTRCWRIVEVDHDVEAVRGLIGLLVKSGLQYTKVGSVWIAKTKR